MTEQIHDNPGADAPLALPDGEPRAGLYRHYKGGMYRVLGLTRHSESLEVMVLYQALYGTQGLWVRPRGMFLETVQHGGTTCPRFARMDDAPECGARAKDTMGQTPGPGS